VNFSRQHLPKTTLRKTFRAYRTTLTPEIYAQKSRLICARGAQIAPLLEAQVVHTYWPAVHKREVDLRPLIMYLRALGKKIVLPVVAQGASTPTLRAIFFESELQLKPNRWGILEPSTGTSVDPSAIDVVIVPALAIDRHGTRLGYGGGYYDVFLSDLGVPTLCPTFDACVADRLIAEPHDVPIDIAFTETRLFHYR